MTVASSSADTLIKLWQKRTDGQVGFACTRTLAGHNHVVSTILFDASGATLYSAGRDETLRAWQIESGHCLWSIKAHDDWIRCIALSPSIEEDAILLASAGNDRSIKLWQDQKEVGVLRGHQHVVECLAFLHQQQKVSLGHKNLVYSIAESTRL